MVWVELKLMGRFRKAIREGSAVDGVKEVEVAEQMNHDITHNVLCAKSDNKHRISG